ncbi:hypothetical protein ONZ45_g10877 [Pleurotus djamor]|nr:hypothetical protein ONZ45_g10877 [Pleurotus djamor]
MTRSRKSTARHAIKDPIESPDETSYTQMEVEVEAAEEKSSPISSDGSVHSTNAEANIENQSPVFTPYTQEEAEKALIGVSSIIRDRYLHGGVYEQIYHKMTSLEVDPSKMLATTEYKIDFHMRPAGKNNFSFNRSDGSLATFMCFGEIAPAEDGTMLSAKGNHFSGASAGGDRFKPITDEAKCKNILVLRRPLSSPPAIDYLYEEQIGLLHEIVSSVDVDYGSDWENREWTRMISTSRMNVPDAIPVSTMPIYGRPKGGPEQVNRIVRKKNHRPETSSGPTLFHASPVYEGAHYEPSVLSDFGGQYFQLKSHKLAQQSFYDMDNALIPPWKVYEELRPGTLVLAHVSLHCFVNPSEKKRYFQVKLEKLRIVGESNEESELRMIPEVPHALKTAELNDDFEDIRPRKRAKLSHKE